MMTPKELAAMQQALEALESVTELYDDNAVGIEIEAITALREALDNSLKRKCFADYQPNHAIDRACASCPVAAECQTGEQAEQEPVAWLIDWPDEPELGHYFAEQPNEIARSRPLYATPVRTKDLTDDEIYTLYSEPCSDREMVEFARAVIAADREKNK